MNGSKRIYLGSIGAGLWVSNDYGMTWQRDEGCLIPENYMIYTLNMSDDGTILVGTENELFKKDKNGIWSDVTPVKGKAFHTSMVYPSDSNLMMAIMFRGPVGTFGEYAYKSSDGGANWTLLKNPDTLSRPTCVQFNPDNYSQIFAIYEGEYDGKKYSGGLFVTDNKGESWVKIPHPSNNNGKNMPRFLEFGAKREDGTRTMYMAYNDMSYPLRMSEDFGKTWRAPDVNKTNNFIQATGYTPEGLALSENDPDKAFYSFGDIVYKTEDAGRTWQTKSSGYSVACVNDFTFTPDGRILFSFVDKGIAIIDEPYEKGKFPTSKMLYEDFGLTHGTSLNIIVNPDNPDDMISNIGGWTEGNYVRTLEGGKNWITLATNMSTIYSVTPDRFDEKACWVGTYDGNIIKFEDTTKTVLGKENGLSDWAE